MSSPSNSDFIAGIDPTNQPTISGAQLLQLIASATPFTDKGLTIITNDVGGNPTVPNATVTTKWQTYIWLRIGATTVSAYVWNPNAAVDVTFEQWQPMFSAAIGAGAIQGFMIADNTIPSIKIISLDYSKLTGAPTGLPPSGNAGGDLTGVYPNPSIAAQAVTSAKIAPATIIAANIANATITVANMAPVSGSAKDMMRVNAGATGMEAFTPPTIFTSGVVVESVGNALKFPQVNAAGNGWQMVASTTAGRILQRTVATTVTQYDSAVAVVAGTITGANGTDIAGLKIVNFVPLSTASRIRVSVKGTFQKATNNGYAICAIFKVATGTTIDGSVNAVGASAQFLPAGQTTNFMDTVYEYANASLAGIDIAARVLGSTNGNASFNPTSGYTPVNLGMIEIIEYI